MNTKEITAGGDWATVVLSKILQEQAVVIKIGGEFYRITTAVGGSRVLDRNNMQPTGENLIYVFTDEGYAEYKKPEEDYARRSQNGRYEIKA